MVDFAEPAPIWDNAIRQFFNLAVGCLQPNWGRSGFDAGCEAEQGMPRSSYLVKQAGNTLNANDERFALAA